MASSVVFVVLIISVYIRVVSSRQYHHHPSFNIVHFGAIPDGNTDSRQSLLHTWQRVCDSKVPAVMVIPRGDFLHELCGFRGPVQQPACNRSHPWSGRRSCKLIRLVQYMQLLALENVNNVLVKRLRFWNSQMFHISVNGCNNANILGVKIKASGTSDNTDGIHIEKSTRVNIVNAHTQVCGWKTYSADL